MRIYNFCFAGIFLSWTVLHAAAPATQSTTVKIGTVIPDGSKISVNLKQMTKEIEEKTQGRVKLQFVWGGVAGDESDVLRKIRIKQFDGGIFTAKTLSDVVGDVRILEIPFTFKDREQAKMVLSKISDGLAKQFAARGFVDLGLYEFGEIFLVTKEKVESIKDLGGKKLWLYQGDQLAEAFSKSLSLTPVPIALPDVLTALETGLVSAAYAPAIGIVALQWHNKVKYLIEPPFAYHFQGLIVSKSAVAKLSAADQAVLKDIAKSYEPKISEANIQDAAEAKKAILDQGVTVVTWPATDVAKLKEVKESVRNELTGKILTKERVAEVSKLLAN